MCSLSCDFNMELESLDCTFTDGDNLLSFFKLLDGHEALKCPPLEDRSNFWSNFGQVFLSGEIKLLSDHAVFLHKSESSICATV